MRARRVRLHLSWSILMETRFWSTSIGEANGHASASSILDENPDPLERAARRTVRKARITEEHRGPVRRLFSADKRKARPDEVVAHTGIFHRPENLACGPVAAWNWIALERHTVVAGQPVEAPKRVSFTRRDDQARTVWLGGRRLVHHFLDPRDPRSLCGASGHRFRNHAGADHCHNIRPGDGSEDLHAAARTAPAHERAAEKQPEP